MSLSLKQWGMIGAGILIAGLMIALFATRATLAGVKGDRDVTVAKLAVSNASLGRLSDALERVKAEQVSLAQSDAKRAEAAREAMKLADAASKVRQAAIDKLMASAAAMRPEERPALIPASCEVSQAVAEVWK